MAIDYVLFIHGANVRSRHYADPLIELIKSAIPDASSSVVTLPVFFGNLNDQKEAELRTAYEQAPIWPALWFPDLRAERLLRVTGDAALYLSRYIGGAIAERIWNQAGHWLANAQPDDRLHLVTHSLGTVILFDMLFSSRWDSPPNLPGYQQVQSLRDTLYGVYGPTQGYAGIQLSSVTTMGAPISIFSLIDVNQTLSDVPLASHDITPRLQNMLEYLHTRMGGENLPWRNYLHPGDAVGSPLKILLPQLLGHQGQYLDVEDILAPTTDLADLLIGLVVGRSDISILSALSAHASYWNNSLVAYGIANTILNARELVTRGMVRTSLGCLGADDTRTG
jgi:hypothetical protein